MYSMYVRPVTKVSTSVVQCNRYVSSTTLKPTHVGFPGVGVPHNHEQDGHTQGHLEGLEDPLYQRLAVHDAAHHFQPLLLGIHDEDVALSLSLSLSL